MASKRSTPSFKGLMPASSAASRVGVGNSAKETSPEIELRKALWRLGYRYRIQPTQLPGRPDIVFMKLRVAVFCDGDFWHGRNWAQRKRRLARGSNSTYWVAKIKANRARDRRNDQALTAMGWRSIRVWETDIRSNLDQAVKRIVIQLFDRNPPK
jgi:DNA mismatch endonuclease, patch repair protein